MALNDLLSQISLGAPADPLAAQERAIENAVAQDYIRAGQSGQVIRDSALRSMGGTFMGGVESVGQASRTASAADMVLEGIRTKNPLLENYGRQRLATEQRAQATLAEGGPGNLQQAWESGRTEDLMAQIAGNAVSGFVPQIAAAVATRGLTAKMSPMTQVAAPYLAGAGIGYDMNRDEVVGEMLGNEEAWARAQQDPRMAQNLLNQGALASTAIDVVPGLAASRIGRRIGVQAAKTAIPTAPSIALDAAGEGITEGLQGVGAQTTAGMIAGQDFGQAVREAEMTPEDVLGGMLGAGIVSGGAHAAVNLANAAQGAVQDKALQAKDAAQRTAAQVQQGAGDLLDAAKTKAQTAYNAEDTLGRALRLGHQALKTGVHGVDIGARAAAASVNERLKMSGFDLSMTPENYARINDSLVRAQQAENPNDFMSAFIGDSNEVSADAMLGQEYVNKFGAALHPDDRAKLLDPKAASKLGAFVRMAHVVAARGADTGNQEDIELARRVMSGEASLLDQTPAGMEARNNLRNRTIGIIGEVGAEKASVAASEIANAAAAFGARVLDDAATAGTRATAAAAQGIVGKQNIQGMSNDAKMLVSNALLSKSPKLRSMGQMESQFAQSELVKAVPELLARYVRSQDPHELEEVKDLLTALYGEETSKTAKPLWDEAYKILDTAVGDTSKRVGAEVSPFAERIRSIKSMRDDVVRSIEEGGLSFFQHQMHPDARNTLGDHGAVALAKLTQERLRALQKAYKAGEQTATETAEQKAARAEFAKLADWFVPGGLQQVVEYYSPNLSRTELKTKKTAGTFDGESETDNRRDGVESDEVDFDGAPATKPVEGQRQLTLGGAMRNPLYAIHPVGKKSKADSYKKTALKSRNLKVVPGRMYFQELTGERFSGKKSARVATEERKARTSDAGFYLKNWRAQLLDVLEGQMKSNVQFAKRLVPALMTANKSTESAARKITKAYGGAPDAGRQALIDANVHAGWDKESATSAKLPENAFDIRNATIADLINQGNWGTIRPSDLAYEFRQQIVRMLTENFTGDTVKKHGERYEALKRIVDNSPYKEDIYGSLYVMAKAAIKKHNDKRVSPAASEPSEVAEAKSRLARIEKEMRAERKELAKTGDLTQAMTPAELESHKAKLAARNQEWDAAKKIVSEYKESRKDPEVESSRSMEAIVNRIAALDEAIYLYEEGSPNFADGLEFTVESADPLAVQNILHFTDQHYANASKHNDSDTLSGSSIRVTFKSKGVNGKPVTRKINTRDLVLDRSLLQVWGDAKDRYRDRLLAALAAINADPDVVSVEFAPKTGYKQTLEYSPQTGEQGRLNFPPDAWVLPPSPDGKKPAVLMRDILPKELIALPANYVGRKRKTESEMAAEKAKADARRIFSNAKKKRMEPINELIYAEMFQGDGVPNPLMYEEKIAQDFERETEDGEMADAAERRDEALRTVAVYEDKLRNELSQAVYTDLLKNAWAKLRAKGRGLKAEIRRAESELAALSEAKTPADSVEARKRALKSYIDKKNAELPGKLQSLDASVNEIKSMLDNDEQLYKSLQFVRDRLQTAIINMYETIQAHDDALTGQLRVTASAIGANPDRPDMNSKQASTKSFDARTLEEPKAPPKSVLRHVSKIGRRLFRDLETGDTKIDAYSVEQLKGIKNEVKSGKSPGLLGVERNTLVKYIDLLIKRAQQREPNASELDAYARRLRDEYKAAGRDVPSWVNELVARANNPRIVAPIAMPAADDDFADSLTQSLGALIGPLKEKEYLMREMKSVRASYNNARELYAHARRIGDKELAETAEANIIQTEQDLMYAAKAMLGIHKDDDLRPDPRYAGKTARDKPASEVQKDGKRAQVEAVLQRVLAKRRERPVAPGQEDAPRKRKAVQADEVSRVWEKAGSGAPPLTSAEVFYHTRMKPFMAAAAAGKDYADENLVNYSSAPTANVSFRENLALMSDVALRKELKRKEKLLALGGGDSNLAPYLKDEIRLGEHELLQRGYSANGVMEFDSRKFIKNLRLEDVEQARKEFDVRTKKLKETKDGEPKYSGPTRLVIAREAHALRRVIRAAELPNRIAEGRFSKALVRDVVNYALAADDKGILQDLLAKFAPQFGLSPTGESKRDNAKTAAMRRVEEEHSGELADAHAEYLAAKENVRVNPGREAQQQVNKAERTVDAVIKKIERRKEAALANVTAADVDKAYLEAMKAAERRLNKIGFDKGLTKFAEQLVVGATPEKVESTWTTRKLDGQVGSPKAASTPAAPKGVKKGAANEVAKKHSAVAAAVNGLSPEVQNAKAAFDEENNPKTAARKSNMAAGSKGMILEKMLRLQTLLKQNGVDAEIHPDIEAALTSKKSEAPAAPTAAGAEAIEAAVAEVVRLRGDKVRVMYHDVVATLGGSGTYTNTDELKRVVRLAVDSISPVDTARHEAIHDLWATLGKSPKIRAIKNRIENFANGTMVRQFVAVAMADSEGLTAGTPEHTEATIRYLRAMMRDREEAVAYLYQTYLTDPRVYKLVKGQALTEPDTLMGKAARLATDAFDKLAEFINSVLGVVTEQQQIENVLAAMHAGKFADQDLQDNAFVRAAGRTLMDKTTDLLGPIAEVAVKVYTPGLDRMRDMGVPALRTVADRILTPNNAEYGAANFVDQRDYYQGRLLSLAGEVLEGATKGEIEDALHLLQARDEKTNNPIVKNVRDLFAKARVFAAGIGVDIKEVPNYFPTVWDMHAIMADRDNFAKALAEEGDMSLAEAEHVIDNMAMVDDGGSELAEHEYHHNFVAPMGASKARKFKFITPKNAGRFAKYQVKDIEYIMEKYMAELSHRMAFAAMFGDKGEHLEKLFKQAKEQGATPEELETARYAVQGALGILDPAKFTPAMRNASAWGMTAMNMAMLPLALASQLIDPLALAARTGKVSDAGKAYMQALRGLGKTLGLVKGENKGEKMAKWLGVLETNLSTQALGHIVRTPGGALRKINNAYFKVNGMQGFNNAMRVAAMTAGLDYLDEAFKKGDAIALNELGLRMSDEARDENGELDGQSAAISKALVKFVRQAVVKPDNAYQATWMNDPRFAFLTHMRRFTYAFSQNVFDRALNQFSMGNTKPAAILAASIPVMIAVDMAKWVLTGTGPNRSNWSTWDYVVHGFNRSGLAGRSAAFISGVPGGFAGEHRIEWGPGLELLHSAANLNLDAVLDKTVLGHKYV